MGEAGEGRNITHQQKKLNEDELKVFRDRFDIPVSDREIKQAPFRRFCEKSEEYEYLMERRKELGGTMPHRRVRSKPLAVPKRALFDEFYEGSEGRTASTTMAYMRMLARLLRDKEMGKLIVPIVPDEARTFGMEALFNSYGIYAHSGQLYEPVDAHLLMKYAERKSGQILEEGISEAGSMASFTAAGTAYATPRGLNMIPFFTFYSMFGFQRIGRFDLGRGRQPLQRLSGGRDRWPHDACGRRLAAPGRTQPARRQHRAELRVVRSGVRVRNRRNHPGRHPPDVPRA